MIQVFHTLNSPEIGRNWLLSHGLSYAIPENPIPRFAILIQALSIDPDYLWQPIFEGLGRYNVQIKRVPTHEQIKEVMDKEHVPHTATRVNVVLRRLFWPSLAMALCAPGAARRPLRY